MPKPTIKSLTQMLIDVGGKPAPSKFIAGDLLHDTNTHDWPVEKLIERGIERFTNFRIVTTKRLNRREKLSEVQKTHLRAGGVILINGYPRLTEIVYGYIPIGNCRGYKTTAIYPSEIIELIQTWIAPKTPDAIDKRTIDWIAGFNSIVKPPKPITRYDDFNDEIPF